MIKSFYYNKKAILIISVMNMFIFIMLFVGMFFEIYKIYVLFISLIVPFALLLAIQLIIFITSYGRIEFSHEGIRIFGKVSKMIMWENVKGIYYNDFLLIGEFNSIDVLFEEDGKKIIQLDEEIGSLACSKSKYKKVIQLIPQNIIDSNDFIFYENVFLKNKDKFHLYNK